MKSCTILKITLSRWGWFVVLLLTSGLLAQAAPPDLTAPGVIATIDRSATYNLGPSGLRGWIYLSGGGGNTHGADGTMTGESRQILVTVASAPGSAVLAVDDVILGAMAASSGTVADFSSDARKALGAAIGDAEKAGAGTLRVKRWRAGVTTDENIAMAIMGDYTASAPYSCPKSSLILANARNKLVGQLLAPPPAPSILSNDWSGAISGLALLAGVQSGDPDHATVQTRLQTYARARATAGPVDNGLPIWDWAYTGLFLAEYYLATGDANVLPGIHSYTLKLAESQSINGTFGHSASVFRPDGSGRRMGIGYGPVNAVGIVANMAIVIGRKALLAGSQTIDPEVDGAIQRGSDFFAFYVNKGPIPYGEHEPFISGHSSNGKDPMCAVLFGVQSGRAAETEYYSRMTTASYRGREYGHTGQGFSYLWSAMGANMGGALAVAEHLKPVRWHLDLSRRTDGSFAYDGAEQYGGGETSDGSYLGASGYYGMNATACYILTYALPLQRLHITGKNADPVNTLDSTKVAHAVAAANFKVDSPGFSNARLITSLSDFDPVVRHYAAIELGKRTTTITPTELTTLRDMLTGTNANGRMGACQALGLLQDLTALPTIVQRLDKTPETDLWVRAKAASAIRSYTPATASTYRDTMLTRFTANATDPDVIVWSDPIQMSNNFLSLALFGDSIYGGNNIGTYTVGAAKNLLYPAVQAGLKQPDSYSRAGATRFCFDRLPLTDVQALIPDFFKVIEIECLADRMWSADSRANGIRTFSKYKVSEGIPYALAMLEIPEGFGWGSETTVIAGLNALAAYGDAARWTLPTLRTYLGKWSPTSSQYTTLVSTIASIEGAITAAAQVPGLAVANSQVVSTTGSKVITLTGASPRSAVTFTNLTDPAHGTLTGPVQNPTYTPDPGYTGPDSFTFQVTDSLGASHPSAPGTVSIIVGTAGTGLKGDYFDNIDFTNLKLTRTDAQVNFDWGTGSPTAALAADTFSVRWGGLLLVPETGTYTFSTLNSDGARLYVNGAPVIDDYVDQATNWKDGVPVNLTAGQLVDLQLNYYENTGSAVAKLKWTGPSFAGANGAIIGSQWLYDGTGMVRTPYAHAQSVTTVGSTPQAITLSGSGGSLTFTVINPPAHGTLTGTAPHLTYTPAANYSGSDSFTFLVNNGTSNSNPATVSIGIWAGQPVDFFWAAATSGNWSGATSWTNAAGATVVPAATGQPYYRMSISKAGTYTTTQDLTGFSLNHLNTAGTVTLAGTNSLTFAANGTLLPQFNQNSSNAVAVSIPLSLNSTTSFGGTSGGTVAITGQISGPGGLTKDSAGELHLYSTTANNYSGGTVVNNGTLHLGAIIDGVSPLFSNPMGSGPVTLNSGTIKFDRVSATNPLTVNGGTLFSDNGWGAAWSGPITLNGTATVNASWGLTCSGSISGAGGFTKTGTNTLTLSGSNSFTGANRITAGTLACTNSAALGTGPLDIATGARVNLNFTGNRTISALAFDSGAPVAPGSYGSTASPAANKNDTYFSGNGTVTILPSTTTALALTGGSTPSAPGLPLTFSVTVTGTAPTGNVTFYSGVTLLGSSTLNGSSQASFTTGSLAIGTHSITARYVGNATNGTSTSQALLVEIISLLPSAPANLVAAPAGSRVGLTWTLSSGATSYYIKRSLTSGGPYIVIGNPGTAAYDDLTAVNGTTYYYVVSAINTAGESANSNQVNAIPALVPSMTTLASSPVATGPYGSSVTFTATVSASATGAVNFIDGVTVLGTGTLSAGTATFTTSALAVASHSITASYGGDTNFAGSVSTPSAYVVTPISLTITGVTASDKIYDGNTAATLTGGTVSGGVVGGETVTVVPGSGTFASANVGTWSVAANGYSLGGVNSGNYVLSAQPTAPDATITPRQVHLTGTRAYNATVLASAADLIIANKVSGDDLTLSGSADVASKDVGTRALLVNLATPARVQSKTGFSVANSSTSFAVTLNAAPTSGNTLVAVIASRGTSSDRVTGIVSGGASWERVTQSVNSSGSTTEIWSAPVAAGATAGVTISIAAGRCAGVIMEYSGVLTAGAVDQTAASPGATSISPLTGITPLTTQANELWIGGIGHRSSAPALSGILNSFTAVASAQSDSATVANNAKVHALERIVNASGTASSGGTLSASVIWSGTIATLKAASSSTLTLSGTAAGNYTVTGLTGSLEITPKLLTITAGDRVKTYGQTLAFGSGATEFASSGLLDGETIGSVTLTCAGGAPSADAATYPITPSAATGGSFIATNYAINPVPGLLTVSAAPTTITTPPTATAISLGQTLAISTLSGGAGSVPGSFAFTNPATAPPVGTASHGVTFTPADPANYQTALTSVSVTVNAAASPFEAWAANPAHGLTQGINDGPLDDPDYDSYSNLMEFVLGGAPMVSSQVIQPKLAQVGGNWVFSYHRSHLSEPAATQIVEYGDTLTGWTPLTIPAETAGAVNITTGASSDLVEVIIPAPGDDCLIRLKVVIAP